MNLAPETRAGLHRVDSACFDSLQESEIMTAEISDAQPHAGFSLSCAATASN